MVRELEALGDALRAKPGHTGARKEIIVAAILACYDDPEANRELVFDAEIAALVYLGKLEAADSNAAAAWCTALVAKVGEVAEALSFEYSDELVAALVEEVALALHREIERNCPSNWRTRPSRGMRTRSPACATRGRGRSHDRQRARYRGTPDCPRHIILGVGAVPAPPQGVIGYEDRR